MTKTSKRSKAAKRKKDDISSSSPLYSSDDPLCSTPNNAFKELQEQIDELKSSNIQLKAELEKVKSTNIDFEAANDDLQDRMYYLEVDMAKLEQYTRRENLQIRGIPSNINQSNLEAYVIDILGQIGVKVQSYHIAACHRLYNKNKKYPADTIVRFINRNDCLKAYMNNKFDI